MATVTKCISIFVVAVIAQAMSCTIQQKPTSVYTTTDASVLTSIAYIAEFSAQNCAGSPTENLYAVVNGNIVQLAKLANSNYLLSWTSEVAQATRGDHAIEIYNEDGNAALKKAAKGTSGPGSTAKPVGSLVLNHPGAYSGPWLNSEHLAAILGVAVGYVAVSSKGRLLA